MKREDETKIGGAKVPLGLRMHCFGLNKKGRSEHSRGWESPLGVRVERRRDVEEQSPGDIWVSVSPI